MTAAPRAPSWRSLDPPAGVTWSVAVLDADSGDEVYIQHADRVLVVHRSRIVASGPVEQVLLDPQDACTKSLLKVVPSRLGRTRP